ncbi:MAG TPA: S8 family peptidase [Longimicrobium sp.]
MFVRRHHLSAAVVLAFALAACDGPTTPPEATPGGPSAAIQQDGRWIVVFKPGVADVPGLARQLSAAHRGTLGPTFRHAIQGFAATLPAQAVEALRRDPRVAYVQPDQVVRAVQTTQYGPPWGLDRIDQRDRPLSGSYTYDRTGSGVTAYVIDTGIETSHSQFGGRASAGFDAFGGSGQDCNGHGTHVAGTLGGSTYGVAKSVGLVAVRVLDCSGFGSTSTVVAGIDWVRANHATSSVANLSLGGGPDQAIDDAIANLVASGVTVVVAAGNDNVDACTQSPARAPLAVTVGATNSSDQEASFSNHGSCVDTYAPGVGITSAWLNGGTNTIDGTSMASPHVAGVAALFLEANPGAAPSTVRGALEGYSTPFRLTLLGPGSGNRIVHSRFPNGGNGRAAIHRLYNPTYGDHAYSHSPSPSGGWSPEYTNYFYLNVVDPGPGFAPLYACYISWRHDWSLSSQASCGGSTNYGLMGFMATSQLSGTVPLYAMEKPGVDWFFTVDAGERAYALTVGWQDRGIAGYVYQQP